MRTTDRSSVFRLNRLPFALFGRLLTVLVTLTVISPPASAVASETSDVTPAVTRMVPEPATLIFFGAAATALFRRKWSRTIR